MGNTNRQVSKKTLSMVAMFGVLASAFRRDNKIKRRPISKGGGSAYGGGRKSASSSDAVIFSPQRKKMKGYERDHATGKKRVA